MEDEGNGHIPPSALSPRFDRESPVADVRRSRPGPRITAAALLCTVSVLFGPAASGALGPPTVVAVPNPSPANDAEFGVGVAGLEDLNGDGVGDLAVGAPGAGRVDILSGVDRTVLRTIADPGAVVGGGFGFAVADVGDVNGDGRDDVAVGAPGSCFGQLCPVPPPRSEEHTSELQSRENLVCRLLLEKKKKIDALLILFKTINKNTANDIY